MKIGWLNRESSDKGGDTPDGSAAEVAIKVET